MSGIPDPFADVAALRVFAAVARTGSVVRAASLLGRTQPAVSARLASLERGWSTRLFRREARGMSLTPEGARLLPIAEAALRSLTELDRAAGAPVAPAGELRVGAGDALGRELLPRALSEMLGEDPGLAVRLVEGPGARLVEQLRDGSIDLALVVDPGGAPRSGVRLEALTTSPIDVLYPPSTAPRGRSVRMESLRSARIVSLHPGSGFRRHLADAFAAAGVPFEPAVEVGNLSLVRRFVAAGLGAAPVPAIAFSDGSTAGPVERKRLPEVPPVAYAAAFRDGTVPGEAASRLISRLRRLVS